MNDYELSMSCVILHNGIHIDTWYNVEHFEICDHYYFIKYRGEWHHFPKDIYNIGYFWVTPDIVKKHEIEEEFLNKRIDELWKQTNEELENCEN